MTTETYVQKICEDDIQELAQEVMDSFDETLTYYDNFKDFIAKIYARGFDKWFLVWFDK